MKIIVRIMSIILMFVFASMLSAMLQEDSSALLELPFAFDDIKSDWQHSAKKIKRFVTRGLHRKEVLRRHVPVYTIEANEALFSNDGLISSTCILNVLQKNGIISQALKTKLSQEPLFSGSYNERIVGVYLQQNQNRRPLFFLKYYQNGEHMQATDENNLLNPGAQKLYCKDVLQNRIRTFTKSLLARLATDCTHCSVLLSSREKTLLSDVPSVAQTECFVHYTDQSGHQCCVEVIHAARGHKFCIHLATKEQQVLIGKALSAAHQLCAVPGTINGDPSLIRTQPHGDFHSENICLTEKGRVWLIDCESVALSHDNPQPIDQDIVTFIVRRLMSARVVIELGGWQRFCNALPAFLGGYISLYPLSMQNSLAQYIKTFLNRRFENVATIIGYAKHGCSESIINICEQLTRNAVGPHRSVYSWQEEAFYEVMCNHIIGYKNTGFLNQFETAFKCFWDACIAELDRIKSMCNDELSLY